MTKTGASDLTVESGEITGYSIVNAESIDEAQKLLDGCPIFDFVRIYEAATM